MTPDRWAAIGLALTLAVGLVGLWHLVQARLERAELARRSELTAVEYEASLLRARLDAVLRRTRIGHRLQLEISRAGVVLSALDLLLLYVGATVGVGLVLLWLGPPWFAVLGSPLGIWIVRQWLERRRQARLEDFVAQLPELARTLSNATAAGRSLLSALQLAAADLDEPARSELRRLGEELRIGQPVDRALEAMRERLPSRELGVLASTLVIQQRTGGDVVTALRDMAETLEARKDLRREVRTIVSSAIQTGYVTGGMGVAIIGVVSLMQPGMIDGMLRRPLGQVALLAATGLYIVAFVAVRRMTDIDV